MPSSKLIVTVVAGRNLAIKDSNGFSDPYVYVWTVPELHSKTRCKSKTIYKSLNPEWEETFEFEVDTSNPDAELRVQVWDYDRFASDDFMGTISIPLHSLMNKKEVDEWYTLQARENKKDEVSGDIRVRSQLKTNEENESISLETKERDKRFIDIVDPAVLKKLTPQERKRQEIIFELINTEELYVNDLKVIINSFMIPLEEKKLISPPELGNLFSNVKAILPVNEALLASLKARQEKNPVIETIGDVLLEHVDALRVYNVYCSNQTVATEKVDEYRNAYPAFAAFIDQPREECRRLPLTGFLVKPLQRLCKYPLLVRELLKDLPDSHPDYKHLSATNDKVKAIIDDANERTRQVEQLVKLQTIRELFAKSGCNEILKGGRQFVTEARATLVKNGEKSVEVLAILFNDMCFLSKQKKETLSKVAELPLNVVSVRSIDNTADASCLIEFRLINDAWVLEMNTEEEKANWLAKVQEKKAVALYDDIMKHGEGISEESELPSVQSLVDSADVKTKVVDLLERVKKERSLRVLAEKALADARKQTKELTQANDLLQGQLDQAVSSFASLEKASSSGSLLNVRSESVDHISRNKSPLAFKNPLRSVAKPLLQASSDSQIKRKRDMELAPPGGSARTRTPSSDRSASPSLAVTPASPGGTSKEVEERLRREKKKSKRLQVRVDEMEAIVKELKAGKEEILEEKHKLSLQVEQAKPSEYLKDQVTALARQNESLERQLKELREGSAPEPAKATSANSDVMEALRREVAGLRKENETVQELKKKVATLEKQLKDQEAAPAISISTTPASSAAAPRATAAAKTTSSPAKPTPAKSTASSAAKASPVKTSSVTATSTAKTQTSSGKTLDVLRPVGSRSKTPAGNVSTYKSRNASLSTPSSSSSSGRPVTPVLRPAGYKGDDEKKKPAGGARPSIADRMKQFEKS
mmetsp:Transcript_2425/g.8659  ORF Transcript_2425/g.8659 Transcript_2425/m.8659 type:complete len:934 (-) Transcript_2425:51-2852(-)